MTNFVSPSGCHWMALRKLAAIKAPVFERVPGPMPRTRREAMSSAEAFEARVLAGGKP